MERAFHELQAKDIDYIIVRTTSAGPFADDVFYHILAGKETWNIPAFGNDAFMDWLKTIPDVDYEEFIQSMASTEDRLFILYRGKDNPVLGDLTRERLLHRLQDFLRLHFEMTVEQAIVLAGDIYKSYSEEHRRYHNLRHILACLVELDGIPDLDLDRNTLELAIWYHDIIYVSGAVNNESESAARMKDDLGMFKTRINLEVVRDLILCSPAQPKTLEERYFIDIDFSVVGQRPLEYLAYSQNIRHENNSVPWWFFFYKRRAFLKSLQKREIFRTELYKNRLDETARENIKGELKSMPFPFNLLNS